MTQQEAENHCIDLPDDDPAAVEAMLQYLYTLDCTVESHIDYMYDHGEEVILLVGSDEMFRQTPFPQLVFDVSMYHMGDKYGIHGLKGMASEKFAGTLECYAKGPFSSISAQALAVVIRRIYDSTPESDKGLRHHVLGFAKRHLKHLLALEDFKMALAEMPEFSYQLLVQEAEGRVEEDPVTRKRKKWLVGKGEP